jgi:hypothetical protein
MEKRTAIIQILVSTALLWAVAATQAQTEDVSAVASECGVTVLTNLSQIVVAIDNPGLTYPQVFPYDAGFDPWDTWFADFSQLPEGLAAIQNYPGQEQNGVVFFPLRVIQYADTGETVLQYPYFGVELLWLPSPPNYQPFQPYNEKLSSYCQQTGRNPTNYEALISRGEWFLDPPRICMDLWVAPLACCAAFESNLEAQAEADAAAATTAQPSENSTLHAMGMGGGFMAMDDDGGGGDPCSITNETAPFSIVSVTMSGQGCTLQWTSCTDHVYIVQAEGSLTPTSSWTNVAWMFGANQTTSWTDTNAPAYQARFYQVARANPNTLNNGIPYGWAVNHDLDPLDTNLATEDPAGDGIDNLQKYQCGLDPLVPYVIPTPTTVSSGMFSNSASIPAAGAGVSYPWTVTNGTITTGQGTPNITWTPGNPGAATICVTLSNSSSCTVSICTNIAVTRAYYVDYSSGSDGNNGTNATIPWRHCPGDQQYGGFVSALHPGDTVFFKGGVQYVLAGDGGIPYGTGIGMYWSGSSNKPITYMSTNAWGTGRAIFTDNYSSNFIAAFYIYGSASNLVFNNLEFGPIGGTNSLPTMGSPSGNPGATTTPSNGVVFFDTNVGGVNFDAPLYFNVFNLCTQFQNTYIANAGTLSVNCTNTVASSPFVVTNTTFSIPAGGFVTSAIAFPPVTPATGWYTNAVTYYFSNGVVLVAQCIAAAALPPKNGYGIWAYYQMYNVTVENCYFHDLGYWQNAGPLSGNTVAGNGDCVQGFSSSGIRCSGGSGITVTNCEFTKVHTGVEINAGTNSSNISIVGNNLHDYIVWGIILDPTAGLIQNVNINNNLLHDAAWAFGPTYQTMMVTPNVSPPHQDPMYVYNPSNTQASVAGAILSNINIYANTWTTTHTNATMSADLYLEYAPSVNVYNNLFDAPNNGGYGASYPIDISWELNQGGTIRILNNTFLVNQPGANLVAAIEIGCGGYVNPPLMWPPNAYLQILNNVAYSFLTSVNEGDLFVVGTVTNQYPLAQWTIDYNDWNPQSGASDAYFWWNNSVGFNTNGGLSVERYVGFDAHGITNTPSFLSLAYGATTNSYLNKYSITNGPTVGVGTNLSGLNLPGLNADINGNPRPSSGAWDLGAYQH